MWCAVGHTPQIRWVIAASRQDGLHRRLKPSELGHWSPDVAYISMVVSAMYLTVPSSRVIGSMVMVFIWPAPGAEMPVSAAVWPGRQLVESDTA